MNRTKTPQGGSLGKGVGVCCRQGVGNIAEIVVELRPSGKEVGVARNEGSTEGWGLPPKRMQLTKILLLITKCAG